MDCMGIYVHIPFCVKKCNYCDFLSWPLKGETEQDRYTGSLVQEIGMARQILPENCPVDSVFVGGGTPSILTLKNLEKIFSALDRNFSLEPSAEITIECNPGTCCRTKFQEYRKFGINRISFGVQSADQAELHTLGRIHSFEDAVSSFDDARAAGFDNINIDLMSAIPGQTLPGYKETLRKVLVMEPEHISAYSLIIEEGTPFYERYRDTPPVDEETDRQMYSLTKEMLRECGYERYEISNYARSGYECRHNLKYWSGGDYIGFGVGASSKIAGVRYKNETDPERYADCIRHGESVARQEEILSREDEMSEFFILGLRKTDGVSEEEFEARFLLRADSVYGNQIRKFVENGLLSRKEGRIYLTERGMDISNYVLCEFL